MRVSDGQSTAIQVESSPSAYVGSARAAQERVGRERPYLPDEPRHAATVPAAVRLAIDIDSTLHPYWDQLAEIAQRRFGVELPYETQYTWAIDRLEPEQLKACVDETHRAEHVLAAEPYPGAVEAIQRWHEQGHFIHITSHRADRRAPAHERVAGRRSASRTTSCTAPTTRSRAAWRSGSTC